MLLKISYKLQQIRWQLKHILRFRKPVLEALEYEKLVLSKNGFLLIYWKCSRSSYLQIPAIHKCIFKNDGFVLVPLQAADNIIIEFCNTWYRQKFRLQLTPVDVRIKKANETTILLRDFSATISFESSFKEARPVIFSLGIIAHQLSLHQFSFSINEHTIF